MASAIGTIALIVLLAKAAGLLLLFVVAVSYMAFCFGLMLIFRRIGLPGYIGLIPLFNYYYMITHIGLPGRWFFLSMIPILSPVYAVGIMGRLGKIFHRNLVWSMFWLTVGAPVGVFKIARDPQEPDLALMQAPAPSVADLKNELMQLRKDKEKQKADKSAAATKSA